MPMFKLLEFIANHNTSRRFHLGSLAPYRISIFSEHISRPFRIGTR